MELSRPVLPAGRALGEEMGVQRVEHRMLLQRRAGFGTVGGHGVAHFVAALGEGRAQDRQPLRDRFVVQSINAPTAGDAATGAPISAGSPKRMLRKERLDGA